LFGSWNRSRTENEPKRTETEQERTEVEPNRNRNEPKPNRNRTDTEPKTNRNEPNKTRTFIIEHYGIAILLVGDAHVDDMVVDDLELWNLATINSYNKIFPKCSVHSPTHEPQISRASGVKIFFTSSLSRKFFNASISFCLAASAAEAPDILILILASSMKMEALGQA